MTRAPSKLYVVTCISNPVRYRSRFDLYTKFARHIEQNSNAVLYTVEMAFGDRPHEITDPTNPHHIQLRSAFELWHKENMLNIAIQRLPLDAEYIAWIDADIMFHRPDWVEETIHQLQHYDFVQLFSHATDLDPQFAPIKTLTGFVHDWYHGTERRDSKGYLVNGHPGYAWAARRSALDKVGGLVDFGILGSGDRHMAESLIGSVHTSYNEDVSANYKGLCHEWQRRAEKFIKRNIGYVAGTITHFYHGSKANRLYMDRWKILVDHQFDPLVDIRRDSQGLWQLDDEKPKLRDAVRRYFRQRQEDCTYTGEYKTLP